ncbi:aspartate/glutamate racemase family protein [Alkalihalobacillus sp. TS-13]|uniref:aspartate/glutamate racemase family protein n=1 Tax=Alkalihalobacillus sp. TS-13 TaxID=2842455 RepID=UPI0028936966|nr:aspartate/glutamate racemase family protein [Alkalihalobacillus sp. TS-13]
MSINQSREYGRISEGSNTRIQMKKGQYVSGYSVGILFLDGCWYPTLPGNVANLSTYDFPVVMKVVPGCTQERIHAGDPTLVDDIIAAALKFEKEGAKVICGACGFLGNYQEQVANAVDIPVFLSSVIQLPWIKQGLKSEQSVGVLTADINGLTDDLFHSCGVDNTEYIKVKDLGRLPEFSAITESRGSFDTDIVRREVVKASLELVHNHPDMGAVLLECSDLPPYAADIQRAVGLPVYDFITMIRWAHMATSQKPYGGFL